MDRRWRVIRLISRCKKKRIQLKSCRANYTPIDTFLNVKHASKKRNNNIKEGFKKGRIRNKKKKPAPIENG